MANFIRNAAGALNRNNAQNPGQYPDCQQAPVYNVWPQPQAPPQSYIIYQQPQQRHMPSRYSEEAPKFDGHPWSLKRFFEEIEILAKECNLNQRDQIIHTLRYLDGPDYDLWRSIPASMADSWDRFKQEIMVIYPGAEDDTRTYAAQSLPYTSHPAPYMSQTASYTSQPSPYTSQPASYTSSLYASHPAPYTSQTASYTSQTASYTLQPSPYTSQPAPYTSQLAPYTSSPFISQPAPYNPQPAPYSSQPSTYATRTYPTTPAAQMSWKTPDVLPLGQILTSDAFPTRLAGNVAPQTQNTPQRSYQHPIQQNSQQRHPNQPCRFCSDPDHTDRQCWYLEDYIGRGLCIRDAGNRICMPDNSIVSVQTAPGHDMMEQIDNWHNRPPASTHIQANIREVSMIWPASPMTDENELAELEASARSEHQILQAHRRPSL